MVAVIGLGLIFSLPALTDGNAHFFVLCPTFSFLFFSLRICTQNVCLGASDRDKEH